jgi:hypothetical protein
VAPHHRFFFSEEIKDQDFSASASSYLQILPRRPLLVLLDAMLASYSEPRAGSGVEDQRMEGNGC